jgi:hypothetical protein
MRVIGAGLPRTGTLSLRTALEALGVAPCYHMVNVLSDLSEAPKWRRALDGDLCVTTILEDQAATVDWPGSFFYVEMLELYPDAKVILSVRDGDSWAQSMRDTIWGLFYDDTVARHLSDARACVEPMWGEYLAMMKEMWYRSGLLHGADTTLGYMSNAMTRYNDMVRRIVPRDRLVEWSATDGWAPLCDALEVPIPDAPFPCLNNTTQFDQRLIDAALEVIETSINAPDAGIARAPVAG